MPNYYNPYNFYPASYMVPGYANMNPGFAQAPPPMPQVNQQGPKMMEWVEGEVGAKAYQMPNGWPANSPIPLWDSMDTVIYLKIRKEVREAMNAKPSGNNQNGTNSAQNRGGGR